MLPVTISDSTSSHKTGNSWVAATFSAEERGTLSAPAVASSQCPLCAQLAGNAAAAGCGLSNNTRCPGPTW